jgi:histidinol-phosphate aminotransferase
MTFELSQAVRPNILSLKPYRCARDDYSSGILLDANENTHGPSLSEAASQNICGKHGQLERYPDPHQVKIEAQLSLLREPSYHCYHTYSRSHCMYLGG